jgi:hypothetical protein
MVNEANRISKLLGWIVASIIVGFLPAYIIANSDVEFPSPWLLWVILSIIVSIPIRWFIYGKDVSMGKGKWESPEKIRSQVVNTPQFVGRFDREKGLLDSTARMVEPVMSDTQIAWMGQQKNINITRFRGEILDQNGSPLEYISVELKGDQKKWVGSLVDGDRVRVEGKVEDDGILHAKNAFNYSTNSWVGEVK